MTYTMQKTEEILTYEIYKSKEYIYLHVPVQNLINPKFLLKDNDLYIFLYNYNKCYILKKLSNEIKQSIINRNCFLCESINSVKINHNIVL